MLTDALVNLIPIGSPLSLVAGAGISIPSTNIIDLLGTGVGTAPQNIIGNRTLFGADVGIGGIRPQVEVLVTTALVAVAASTLKVKFQGAADQGAAGNYQPDTWKTLVETDDMTAAQLAIQAVAARFDFPPSFPVNFLPRFLRLLFVPSTGGSFTAGAVLAPVTMVRDDQANRYMANNFSVGALS